MSALSMAYVPTHCDADPYQWRCKKHESLPNVRVPWHVPSWVSASAGLDLANAWPFGDSKAKTKALRKKKRVASQHLYVMSEGDGDVVGRTNNYDVRMRDASGWVHRPLSYVLRVDLGGWAEALVHQMFSEERKHLEWFHKSVRVSDWISAVKMFALRDGPQMPLGAETGLRWGVNKWGMWTARQRKRSHP